MTTPRSLSPTLAKLHLGQAAVAAGLAAAAFGLGVALTAAAVRTSSETAPVVLLGLVVAPALATAVITGASAGIGTEFARQLAARGHGVFLVARREDRLRELASEIERDHGVRAEFAACDLGDAADRRNLPGLVARRELYVSVLVNNAGFTTVGDVHLNPDRQLGMIHVNVEALVDLRVERSR